MAFFAHTDIDAWVAQFDATPVVARRIVIDADGVWLDDVEELP